MSILKVRNLTYSIDEFQILKNVDLEIEKGCVSAISGDSGSGKTTFLKILSLLFREQENYNIEGNIFLNNAKGETDILKIKSDFYEVRRRIVYISQVPNPLHFSIYKNVEFPMNLIGIKGKRIVEEKVVSALKDVNLYEEVKDRLHNSALELSGGQRQKLCIARSLVLSPDIILLDEPTSSLDSKNKEIIEDLIIELGKKQTILMVSHDMKQIEKVADRFFICEDKKIRSI
ncbi:MAG: phosphate ABC transporter ATP-binding protein [Candidatus Delongbacteria bacterium]|nr:phosphate ABC transporter ATP-binding protein [Candidatus Delongbacteria bacterium]MBN2836972.1 phosphate ABC transporter ATP-binding protein [Candidatus Delongbacteria bacterium]